MTELRIQALIDAADALLAAISDGHAEPWGDGGREEYVDALTVARANLAAVLAGEAVLDFSTTTAP